MHIRVRSRFRRSIAIVLAVMTAFGVVGIVAATNASAAVDPAAQATAIREINQKRAELGGCASFLGCPTEGIQIRWGRDIFGQRFERGEIVWSPAFHAQPVGGAIIQYLYRYQDRSVYPYVAIDGEKVISKGRNRVQVFINMNTMRYYHVYWSPEAGPHLIPADFMEVYRDMGYENGALGMPTGDLLNTPNHKGYFMNFQGGGLYRKKSEDRVLAVSGDIYRAWGRLGWEGRCGFPIGREGNSLFGRSQHFENGVLEWKSSSKRVEVEYGRDGCPTGVVS